MFSYSYTNRFHRGDTLSVQTSASNDTKSSHGSDGTNTNKSAVQHFLKVPLDGISSEKSSDVNGKNNLHQNKNQAKMGVNALGANIRYNTRTDEMSGGRIGLFRANYINYIAYINVLLLSLWI